MHPGFSPAANVDATERARDLGGGVWQFQAPLWQTNSVLAVEDDEALVCDPALMPAEIEDIRAAAERRAAGAVHVLLTHADFDHICGIGHFPGAEVIAGAETARKLESGRSAEELASAGEEWGGSWPTDDLHVDRIAEPDRELACGPFRIATVDAPSHGREGLAYILLDQGVFLPGDHLSAITYPLLAGPLDRAIRAQERLLDALERYPLRWVVPGHGPALSPHDATEVGRADLGYLERLRAVARDARASGLSPGYALIQAYAVEPPRPTPDDFEVYEIRTGNARLALVEPEGSATES